MARVTLPALPVNGNIVDAVQADSIWNALLAGVNNVDATQLVAGAVAASLGKANTLPQFGNVFSVNDYVTPSSDGSTNHTPALQAMITAGGAGATFVFGLGTWQLGGPLYPLTGQTFIGQGFTGPGYGTVITWLWNSSSAVTAFTNPTSGSALLSFFTGAVTSGGVTTFPATDVLIRDICLDGQYRNFGYNPDAGVQSFKACLASPGTRWRFERVHFYDRISFGISSYGATNVSAHECQWSLGGMNDGWGGTWTPGVSSCPTLTNSTWNPNYRSTTTCYDWLNVDGAFVSGNVFESNDTSAVTPGSRLIQLEPATNSAFVGNRYYGTYFNLQTEGAYNSYVTCHNPYKVSFAAEKFCMNPSTGNCGGRAISFASGSTTTVKGGMMRMTGETYDTPYNVGLFVTGALTANHVGGDEYSFAVRNPNQQATATTALNTIGGATAYPTGAFFTSFGDGTIIHDFAVIDDRSTSQTTSAIQIGGVNLASSLTNRITLHDGHVAGITGSTAAYNVILRGNDADVPNVAVRNVIGVDPLGDITSRISALTSGTAYTNISKFDLLVTVSGGTVSAIAIGGVTVGLTSGAFMVPVGQSITVTWSATPTVKFIAL